MSLKTDLEQAIADLGNYDIKSILENLEVHLEDEDIALDVIFFPNSLSSVTEDIVNLVLDTIFQVIGY